MEYTSAQARICWLEFQMAESFNFFANLSGQLLALHYNKNNLIF